MIKFIRKLSLVIIILFLLFFFNNLAYSASNSNKFLKEAYDALSRKDYAEAEYFFQLILHSETEDAIRAEAIYKLAHCYKCLGLERKSEEFYDWYFEKYPQGEWVDMAKLLLRQARWRREGYKIELNNDLEKSERKTIKAVQVFNFKSSSLEELSSELITLKEIGINTIIVRAFHNPGDSNLFLNGNIKSSGVYFSSKVAPVIDTCFQDVVKISKKCGLKIFAWLPSLKCSWLMENCPEGREQVFDLASRELKPSDRLSPQVPKVRQTLMELYQEAVATGIDGILVQDDLILRHTEGFHPLGWGKYLQKFKKTIIPPFFYLNPYEKSGKWYVKSYSCDFDEYCWFKNRSLMNLLSDLREVSKQKNPNLLIAVNIYYETALFPDKALLWYAQDLQSIIDLDIDYLAFMFYQKQMEEELGWSQAYLEQKLKEVSTKLKNSIANPARLLMKVQIQDWNSKELIPENVIRETIKSLATSNSISTVLVPYNRDIEINKIKNLFRSK